MTLFNIITMYLFSKVFLETTDPLTPDTRLLKLDVLVSIIFHTVLYLLVIKIISSLLNIRVDTQLYINISLVLFFVMLCGYYLRLQRVKSLFRVYVDRGYPEDIARKLSIKLLHKGYMTFYFLG